MKNIVTAVAISLLCAAGVMGQKTTLSPGVQSLELISTSYLMPRPKESGGKLYITQETYDSSRFDLVNFNNGCRAILCLVYGSRVGDNWDIFTVSGGAVSRTRMVRIGKYDWTEKFVVPYVAPWPELAPGETRTVTVNTSGGEGGDGSNGMSGRDGGNGGGVATMNGDGTLSAMGSIKRESYAHAALDKQVGSYVTGKDGKTRKDGYTPMVEARKGHMYAVRVVDKTRDYFVLVRVDDLKRGERLVLSYKKLNLPDSVF